MQLRLYNTLTRQKERFEPIDPGLIRIYVCGPTVYDFAHIGNARPVIVFDVLFRLLRALYGKDHVVYARNITDVDDKINERAGHEFPHLPLNEAIAKVTTATAAQFHRDVAALGCLPPTHEPRATEHIAGMRDIIERLVATGFAYVAKQHVLFSPAAMNTAGGTIPRYGALANRSLDEMIAGARVDVAPYKRDTTDFVLWKPSKPGEPAWPSPCGIGSAGRPGWHIECSAMSKAFLGETFDIHGGGIDLVFPHHENEIAQSCCAHGTARMANIFMHNGFLQVEGQKMSKSLGNFVTIDELLTTEKFGRLRWPGTVLRFAMLSTHYRQPIDWTVRGLEESHVALRSFATWAREPIGDVEPSAEFLEALFDDLNTPRAIAELHRLVAAARQALSNFGARATSPRGALMTPADTLAAMQLTQCLAVLGIDILAHNQHWMEQYSSIDKRSVDRLIAARLAARAAKNWTESDRIRDELAALGIQLKDGKDKDGNAITNWEVKR